MLDIKFHCSEKGNFPQNQLVRGFVYREYSIEVHNHDFYEINIILSGTGLHQIENGSFTVSVGDVFVIPPNVAHSYSNTQHLDVYHILLKKEFVAEEYQQASRIKGFLQFMEIEPFIRGNSQNRSFLRLSGNDWNDLKKELDLIGDDRFGEAEYALLKKHVVWKIVLWMSHLLSQQMEESGQQNSRYRREIVQALEYIHEHYAEKITIELLCKEVFLSRSTFLRHFQALCHCTPMEYLERYRCRKAEEEMSSSGLSKTALAHSCGFYDLSHMNRMLKKWNGGDVP